MSAGLLGLACSGSTASYSTDADRGSTHALVTVERKDTPGLLEPSQARAFATFVRTPPEVEPAMVTRIAGLGLELPELGDCSPQDGPREGSNALRPLDRVELLDAGEVTLETPEGRVELAPRAFPAVSSLFAGVVYTTRERVAALPPGEPYALGASGGELGAPLGVSAEAPNLVTNVTVNGAPLDADAALDPRGSELRWNRGSARDVIYVTLGATDGNRRVTCAFRDEAGVGILPASAMPSGVAANLSLHRLRVVPIVAAAAGRGIDAGELRFDFELSAVVPIRSH